jgi:hypothetical protein
MKNATAIIIRKKVTESLLLVGDFERPLAIILFGLYKLKNLF